MMTEVVDVDINKKQKVEKERKVYPLESQDFLSDGDASDFGFISASCKSTFSLNSNEYMIIRERIGSQKLRKRIQKNRKPNATSIL